jgi:hypothetical protein
MNARPTRVLMLRAASASRTASSQRVVVPVGGQVPGANDQFRRVEPLAAPKIGRPITWVIVSRNEWLQ